MVERYTIPRCSKCGGVGGHTGFFISGSSCADAAVEQIDVVPATDYDSPVKRYKARERIEAQMVESNRLAPMRDETRALRTDYDNLLALAREVVESEDAYDLDDWRGNEYRMDRASAALREALSRPRRGDG